MKRFPDNWDLKPLSGVTLPISKTNPVATGRSNIRYVDIGSIAGPTRHIPELPPIESATAPSRARQVIQAGDTLFSTVRPYLEKIAFVGTALEGEFASTGFSVLRPGNELLPEYLYYYTTSKMLLDQVLPLQKGVSYPAVLDREVKAAKIPVPPLSKQRHIVEILEDHLSRLDAATAYTSSARRRLTRLTQAARQKAVDAPASSLVPLAELVERIETGKSLSGTTPASDDEWGIIKVSAMTWGAFRPEENKRIPDSLAHPAYEIREGDLLVSRANTSAYVGASVLVGPVRPRLLLSDKSLRVVPRSGVDARWLNEVLLAPRTRQQVSALSTGTKESMRNISQKALLSVAVPNTPPAEQLDVMAATLTAADATQVLSSTLDRTAVRAQSLRRALLSAAFSGRLTGAPSDLDRIEELAEVDA